MPRLPNVAVTFVPQVASLDGAKAILLEPLPYEAAKKRARSPPGYPSICHARRRIDAPVISQADG